jgi:hypothetical protein
MLVFPAPLFPTKHVMPGTKVISSCAMFLKFISDRRLRYITSEFVRLFDDTPTYHSLGGEVVKDTKKRKKEMATVGY